jgi:hypothetical protein
MVAATSRAGESRISSESGLKATPSTPTRAPAKPSGPASSRARSTMRARRRMLIASTSRRNDSAWSTPSSSARAMNALMSFGRQPPPKPRPGRRPAGPIRGSWPSASASRWTSPCAASHTSAIALMNEILVARNAFAATFTSSAVARSVARNGTPAAIASAWISLRIAAARADCTPATTRSGRSVSFTACPSRRNSGDQASSAPGASSASRSDKFWAVPTGTVHFPTTRHRRSSSGASVAMQVSSWVRSARFAPAACGVPTQMKWTSPNPAARA